MNRTGPAGLRGRRVLWLAEARRPQPVRRLQLEQALAHVAERLPIAGAKRIMRDVEGSFQGQIMISSLRSLCPGARVGALVGTGGAVEPRGGPSPGARTPAYE